MIGVKFLPWLGSAVLGAFVGAWISAYVSRPRVAIDVLAPSIAEVVPEEENDQQQVSPSPEILQDCGKAIWTGCYVKQQNLREYLKALKFDALQGADILDQLTTLRNAMDRWPKEIKDKNSLDMVYELLRANTAIVVSGIIVEIRQGNRTFHTPNAYKPRSHQYYVIKQDEDGDLFINSGNRTLPIYWTRYLHQLPKEELKTAANRLANAIAYGSTDDLNDVRAAIDRILGSEGATKEHSAHVQAELRAYSRWTIKAIITNSGKDPISLSPKSALYVKTEGQTYKDQEGVQRRMAGDYRIEMGNTESSGGAINFNRAGGETNPNLLMGPLTTQSDDPIVVDGGHAVTATFRSVARIREMDHGPVLLDLYRTSNLTCVLAILPITSHVGQFAASKPIWSAPVAFNETSFRELFPKEVEWK